MTDPEPQASFEPKFEAKDVLLLVPTLASTIAVFWEIARFMPFGGFQYFTLSDHLLAALQGLPTALAISVMPAMAYWVNTRTAGNIISLLPSRRGPCSSRIAEPRGVETRKGLGAKTLKNLP